MGIETRGREAGIENVLFGDMGGGILILIKGLNRGSGQCVIRHVSQGSADFFLSFHLIKIDDIRSALTKILVSPWRSSKS